MMSRFIADNGSFSTEETYWKNGIIYTSSSTDLLIQVEYEHKTSIFKICVQDKRQQDVDMQDIVEQFAKLNNGSKNIEISNNETEFEELATLWTILSKSKENEYIYINSNKISINDYTWLNAKNRTIISMTLEELKINIRTLIGKGKIQDALKSIATWAHENSKDQLKDQITLLDSSLTTLIRDKTLGLISSSDASVRQNQLNNSVLTLLNNIEEPLLLNIQNTNQISNQMAQQPTTLQPPKIILFITSSPEGLSMANVGKQYSAIKQSIEKTRKEDFYEIKFFIFKT